MIAANPAESVEVPGPDGQYLSDWLKLAILFGGWQLYQVLHKALEKKVAAGRAFATYSLLDERDRAMMRNTLERVIGPSLLLGRAKLRKAIGELEPSRFVETVRAARPLSIDGSLDKIGPALLLATRPATESLRFQLNREVTERAAVIEQSILDRIRDGIESDKTLAFAPNVERLLLGAGLMPRAQPYLPMVIRTEVMDAINRGQADEFREEGLARAYPVWQYHAVIRPTSRLWHARRNGRYWPSAATFQQVRGFGPANICNCLCNSTPVRKDRWDELRAKGIEAEDWQGGE